MSIRTRASRTDVKKRQMRPTISNSQMPPLAPVPLLATVGRTFPLSAAEKLPGVSTMNLHVTPVEVLVDPDKAIGQHQHAHSHHQNAAHQRHHGQDRAGALQVSGDAFQGDRRDDEGDAQSGGVGDEEDGTLGHRVLDYGQADDAAQDRPDAGGPASGEGHAHQEGTAVARSLAMSPADRVLAVQEADVDHTQQVQTHEDEDCAAQLANVAGVVYDQKANDADGGPEDDEDDRKAGDEGSGVEHVDHSGG